MTTTTLEKIIDNINDNKYAEVLYACRSLDEKVDLYNIFEDNCIEHNKKTFYDFYLIKGKDTSIKYVGIILDMIDDLHIFIKKDYRGQGYLQDTLDATILPFISYYKDRDKQDLTFEEEAVKQYFINTFGFKDSGYLSASKYIFEFQEDYDFEKGSAIELSQSNKKDMEKLLDNAILAIRILKRKLDYQKHDDFAAINDYLSDAYWELKEDIIYDD